MPNLFIILCILLAIPIGLFEYFVLFWFWGGDGTFNFIVVPIVFIVFIILHIVLLNRYTNVKLINNILKFSLVFSTPILSMLTVWILAKIFGVDIQIQ